MRIMGKHVPITGGVCPTVKRVMEGYPTVKRVKRDKTRLVVASLLLREQG